jgi:hypothetical protein
MRITANRLETRLAFINRMLGRPATPYTYTAKTVANVGCWYLSASEYGYEVLEIVTESGGVQVVYPAMRASILYAVLGGFLDGIKHRGTVDEAYATTCSI